MPTDRTDVTRPGTAPSMRPRSSATAAVISDPERSPASTTIVIALSPAMIRLRAGKPQRRLSLPGGSSDMAAPDATIRR